MDSFHLTHTSFPSRAVCLHRSLSARTLPSMTMIIQPAALSHFFSIPHAHSPVPRMGPSATASALDGFLRSAALTTSRDEEAITDLLSQLRETIAFSIEIDSATSRTLQAM
ncbi:hypothetical protein HO111_05810 [Corynebacterium ulcerans]|nr:hypothetical protein [Corynebacterium silvaticum]